MKKSRAEYNRQYYAANRKKILARTKEWRKRNVDNRRKIEAAWRKANPEKCAAKQRRYRQKPEIKVKDAAYHRERRAANPEAVRAADRAFYAKAVVRKRAQARLSHAKARLRDGKGYRPQFRLRLPEWAAVGQCVLDVRSSFLAINANEAQRSFARDLAIERSAAE